MASFRFSPGLAGLIVTLALALAWPAMTWADVYFTAVLDGPTAGTTSPGFGTAIFTLNSAETEVSYVIEYSGLVGTETVAHIHNAPPGVIGPVFHDLDYGSPKVGIWEVGAFEVEELNAGRVNILIHSDIFGGGEIRGNLAYHSIADVEMPAGGPARAEPMLRANFPNPFNPQTTIVFEAPQGMSARLSVFDVSGRLVDVLLDGDLVAPGRNEFVWRGRDMTGNVVPAGVYFYRLETGRYSETRRMVLVK